MCKFEKTSLAYSLAVHFELNELRNFKISLYHEPRETIQSRPILLVNREYSEYIHIYKEIVTNTIFTEIIKMLKYWPVKQDKT